ncbi:hypothetical protein [Streptomyces sp. SID161]|nr:hypothetical protein [Streptomyces sp. SID161]MYW45293.1 hypothetical protein [Streptomyces sp. SID161]
MMLMTDGLLGTLGRSPTEHRLITGRSLVDRWSIAGRSLVDRWSIAD